MFTIKTTDILFAIYLHFVRKAQINWKSVEGAFAKPRRLHLAKRSDGLDHCPVTGVSMWDLQVRGCRKHVKTKHGWYYYFDEKPTLCSSPFAVNEPREQGSKIVPCCSADNDFARSFSQWLQSSCGRGKSRKQSDVSVTRALKFLKFCCDKNGEAEDFRKFNRPPAVVLQTLPLPKCT